MRILGVNNVVSTSEMTASFCLSVCELEVCVSNLRENASRSSDPRRKADIFLFSKLWKETFSFKVNSLLFFFRLLVVILACLTLIDRHNQGFVNTLNFTCDVSALLL